MSGPNAPYTQLDSGQVIQQVFDESTDSLRVNANVTANIDADLGVEIDAADGDNIAIANEDGSKKVTVTTVASKNALDVNIVGGVVSGTAATQLSSYDEITGLASGIEQTIVSFTAAADCKLVKIDVSGTNIATYDVRLNSSLIDRKRTYFGNSLNEAFNFRSGLNVPSGQTVEVSVYHNRPSMGDFNARIQIEE